MRTRHDLTGETVMETRDGRKVPIQAACSAIFDETGRPVGGIEVILDQSECKDTLHGVMRLIEAARCGDLQVRAQIGSAQGDYRAMREGVNQMLDAIVGPITEAATVLGAMAERDLTCSVEGEYEGDLEGLKVSINQAIGALGEALQQVGLAAEQVGSASGQISTGSQALAQGASEQASSLEEISSSLEEVGSMARGNADNAKQARAMAESTRGSTRRGMESMRKLSEAVDRIKSSADETAKIVSTIDEIAFQTNLLALNAAVEAARAGEAGKGFAVVAEEVRSLAQRSAEAAKDTSRLIKESVENAETGVSLNQEVMANLGEISEHVEKVGEVMAEIAAASDQQSQGLQQITTGVEQLNQVTQQNAANSEESASAAEELSGQAAELQSMVGRFRLDGEADESDNTRGKAGRVLRPAQRVAPGGNGTADRRRVPGRGHANGNGHTARATRLIALQEEDEVDLSTF